MSTEAPEVVESPPSLRETLTAAFDEAEPASSLTPAASEVPASPPAALPVAASPEAAKPAPSGAEKTPAEIAGKAPAPIPGTQVELKAPAQWKPQVREKWNSLPREVQEEIIRREGDGMRLIGSVGHKIRLADEVYGHMTDFLPRLQESGVHPSHFIKDLFDSVKALSHPDPRARAETVANIVQSYGVDLRLLDQVLTQRIQAGPNDMQARRMMAQAQSVMMQNQQQLSAQTELDVQKSLTAFAADPKHEFLDDVRGLMADLIEAGQVQTLDDAYAAAVWAHPETRKILLQREAESRAKVKGDRAVQARLASSAVHGSPATAAGAVQRPNMSLRDAVTAAFDEHSPA